MVGLLTGEMRVITMNTSLLGSPTLVGMPKKVYWCTFFFFCRDTAFSSRAEYGHQMCIGGSIVGEAPTHLPRELAHSSPNFYRGSKSAKFGIIFNVAQL